MAVGGFVLNLMDREATSNLYVSDVVIVPSLCMALFLALTVLCEPCKHTLQKLTLCCRSSLQCCVNFFCCIFALIQLLFGISCFEYKSQTLCDEIHYFELLAIVWDEFHMSMKSWSCVFQSWFSLVDNHYIKQHLRTLLCHAAILQLKQSTHSRLLDQLSGTLEIRTFLVNARDTFSVTGQLNMHLFTTFR